MTEKKYLAFDSDKRLDETLRKLRDPRWSDLVRAVIYEKGARSLWKKRYKIVLEIHEREVHKGLSNPKLQRLINAGWIGNLICEGKLVAEKEWRGFFQHPEKSLTQPQEEQFSQVSVAPKCTRLDDFFKHLDQEPAPVESAEAFNKLLYWLSARGSGTWQAFCDACEALKIAVKPRRVFRRLRLLGHVEYLDHGKRWQVCPPRVACSADGSYSYLIGQRTPSMLQTLPHQPVPQSNAPDLIKLPPKYTAERFTSVGVVSLSLAERLPRWCDLPQRWQKVDLPHLRYRIERWDGSNFCIHVERPHESGMYRYTDQFNEQYVFYDGSALRQGDWYGMQYLAQAHLGRFPKCLYSEAHHACWLSAHLPDLYERALVLASGRLPELRALVLASGRLPELRVDGWLFRNVSSALMKALRARLNF